MTAARFEYRISWPRPDRPHERRSKVFQLRTPAERFARRIAARHDDVRIERREVGNWHVCRRQLLGWWEADQ